MNKFKVGDRIRVSDKNLYNYNEIGVVIRTNYYNKYMNKEYNSKALAVKLDYNNMTLCIGEDKLELVKERENNMEFTLSDLTDDMIVELRNKEKYLIVSNGRVMIGINGWLSINDYLKDLTVYGLEEFNIDKVWKIITKNGYTNLINLLTNEYISTMIKCNEIELVYDRNKPLPKKMTVQQICDELGYEVEIVKE